MHDQEIGHFDVVRLKNNIEVIYSGGKLEIPAGSVGVSLFWPYFGVGILFEKITPQILVPFDENADEIEIIFRNIRSTVRIQHIRDDADLVSVEDKSHATECQNG